MAIADVNGIRLDYEERGRRSDRAVLLIMGLGSQRIVWPPELVEHLVGRGYRVITFDNRDVGRSTIFDDHPVDGDMLAAAVAGADVEVPYTLGDMARDAVGLLDHLGVDRAHVVGASMGGMVAQHLAFDHAACVLSLTSMMSCARAGDLLEADREVIAALFASAPRDRAEFVEQAVQRRRLIGSPDYFDEGRVRRLAEQVYDRGVHPAGTARQLLAIFSDGDRTERLRRVQAPVLVLHGALDPLVPIAGGQATAAAVPQSELLALEGMAHDLPAPLLPRIADALCRHFSDAEARDETAA